MLQLEELKEVVVEVPGAVVDTRVAAPGVLTYIVGLFKFLM